MSEQDKELDVEAHRVAQLDGTEDDEDTEGHPRVAQLDGAEDDEDTGGRRLVGTDLTDDDDVEAHVQPPRDTDLGSSPR